MGPEVNFALEAKHVFWSNNEVGNALYQMLDHLVKIGALEYDEEQQLYRWNPSFRGSWEQ
jgi:hypothetical protein